jgi:hypothetical protein
VPSTIDSSAITAHPVDFTREQFSHSVKQLHRLATGFRICVECIERLFRCSVSLSSVCALELDAIMYSLLYTRYLNTSSPLSH